MTLAILVFCSLPAWAEDAATADARLLPRKLPGAQPGGSVLLPNQWSLRPAGRQIEVGNFPVNVALHPRGHWAVILHSGYGPHAIVVVDRDDSPHRLQRYRAEDLLWPVLLAQRRTAFASGGEDDVVHEFHFADGYLYGHKMIDLPKSKTALVAAGLACSPDGQSVYAACCLGDRLFILRPDHAGDRRQIDLPARSYPYLPVVARKTNRLYLSLWGKSAVAVIDLDGNGKCPAIWPTASHPTEMVLSPDEETLYVACADSSAVSVLDTQTGRELERIGTSLYPKVPNGSTPDSLALAPNGNTLWVANADANNVAVFDVSHRGQSRSLGFLPVGWYPTSVRISAAADHIFVANGKGLTSKANRNGPNPLLKKIVKKEEYIGGLFPGALSVIRTPELSQMAALTSDRLRVLSGSIRRQSHRPPAGAGQSDPGQAWPAEPDQALHLHHQGKPHVRPGFRRYSAGQRRAGAVHFSRASHAESPCAGPAVRAPGQFLRRRRGQRQRPRMEHGRVCHGLRRKGLAAGVSPGTEHAKDRCGGSRIQRKARRRSLVPSSGYLWDRCREASVSYRSYGEFIENGSKPADPGPRGSRPSKATSIPTSAALTWSTATSGGPTASSRS